MACRPGPPTLAATAAWAALAAASSTARADGWRARGEVAAEYDSNVGRVEQDPEAGVVAEGAPVARVGVAVSGRGDAGRWGRWALSGSGGVRAVVGPPDGEDLGVLDLDAAWERRLGDRAATVGARGAWYDARPLGGGPGTRTYALGAADLVVRLGGEDGDDRFAASAGLRRFRYVPDPAFDWDGPALGARYARTLWRAAAAEAGLGGIAGADAAAATLELAVAYRVEARGFAAPALRDACAPGEPVTPACFVATSLPRGDLHHVAELELAYAGDVAVTGGYALTVDDSSSFGHSLLRHRGSVAATVGLPAGLFASAVVALQFDAYLDPVLLARAVAGQGFTTLDDDNRSSASLRVSRRIARGLVAEVRAVAQADSLSGDDLPFRRVLASIGLTWDGDPDAR